jgi:hypothetical protein
MFLKEHLVRGFRDKQQSLSQRLLIVAAWFDN